MVFQRIPPDRLVVAVGGPEPPGQDRACLPRLSVHRIDEGQVLMGIGDHGELPRRSGLTMALARCTLS